MLCPVCRQPQVIVEFDGIELDTCIDDHGVWFDQQELGILLAAVDPGVAVADLESQLTVDNAADHGPRRRCPRCQRKMDHVRARSNEAPVILDRCPAGHGIWFDQGELQVVLAGHLGVHHPALDRIRNHLTAFEPQRRPDPAPAEEND